MCGMTKVLFTVTVPVPFPFNMIMYLDIKYCGRFGSLLACESFHADVHAGNLWLLRDGRIGFLDFGMLFLLYAWFIVVYT